MLLTQQVDDAPVVEPVAGPVAGPVAEPVVELVVEPAAVSITGPFDAKCTCE